MAKGKGKSASKEVKHRKPIQKSEDLHFRVTAGQKAAMERGAARVGLTVSSWIITTMIHALSEQGIEVEEPDEEQRGAKKK